jgi:hypothetical protein
LLPTLHNLDVITNKAEIVFDQEAPVNTPVWYNTLDLQPPVSAVLPLSGFQPDSVFTVHWTGSDGESGIKHYHVYVSENDSAYKLWMTRTSLDSGIYRGRNGVKYEFYSVAVDSVNNREEPPVNPDVNPDAVTTVSVLVNLLAPVIESNRFSVFPNPAMDKVTASFEIQRDGYVSVLLLDVSGETVLQKDFGNLKKGSYEKLLDISNLSNGLYFVKIRADKYQKPVKLSISR